MKVVYDFNLKPTVILTREEMEQLKKEMEKIYGLEVKEDIKQLYKIDIEVRSDSGTVQK